MTSFITTTSLPLLLPLDCRQSSWLHYPSTIQPCFDQYQHCRLTCLTHIRLGPTYTPHFDTTFTYPDTHVTLGLPHYHIECASSVLLWLIDMHYRRQLGIGTNVWHRLYLTVDSLTPLLIPIRVRNVKLWHRDAGQSAGRPLSW